MELYLHEKLWVSNSMKKMENGRKISISMETVPHQTPSEGSPIQAKFSNSIDSALVMGFKWG